MRAAVLLLPLVTFLAAGAQDPAKTKTPKSGDTIVVKGCLRGGTLSATEMGLVTKEDEEDRQPAGHTFHLKGNKDLLKGLREKFDGHVVEVTGVLKSQLIDTSARGTQVGNTRIVVGAESSMRGGTPGGVHGGSEALPVLEAKSFEGSSTPCQR